jgi:hypothetical protein
MTQNTTDDATEYQMPSNDEFRPLLKGARKLTDRRGDRRDAVALFDADGTLVGGPRHLETGRIDWGYSGPSVEVSASGAFTSYDDLQDAWRRAQRRE